MSQDRRESTTPTPQGSSMPARVRVIPYQEGERDSLATKMLLEAYGDEDGFHCPACHITIKDPNEAVEHLADEINTAMLKLVGPSPTPKSSSKERS